MTGAAGRDPTGVYIATSAVHVFPGRTAERVAQSTRIGHDVGRVDVVRWRHVSVGERWRCSPSVAGGGLWLGEYAHAYY